MFPKTHRKILIISLLSINFIYFISSSYPVMTSNDGSHFALVSALVEDGSFKINKYIDYTYFVDFNLKDGNYYSDRPPGTALLSIPFYALGKFYRETGLDRYLSYQINISKVFVIFLPNIAGTIAILLLFRLYTFLKFSFSTSMLSCFLFAFSTLSWFESTRLFSHSVSMVTILCAVFLVVTLNRFNYDNIKPIIAVSALLAVASIIEIQNILFVFPFMIYILLSKKFNVKDVLNRNTLKPLVIAILLFAAVYSILLAYNFIVFDELTIKSNKYNPVFPEESSFFTSLSGNFYMGMDRLFINFTNKEVIFDWSKGIKNQAPGLLIISPILILSLIGFNYFFKSCKNEALFFLILICIEVIIVASHKTVLTRHVFTILPFLFFPVAFIIRKSFEQMNNAKNVFLHRYSLLSIILILSCLSIARVFYIMNSYWTRSLSYPFRFIQEIPSYIVFYGFIFLTCYLFKRLMDLKSQR